MRRLIIILALAVAAGLTFAPTVEAAPSAAGCQFRGEQRPAAVKSPRSSYRKARQWIYGDSITWQTYKNLRKTLPGRQAVDAYWGRNTASAVEALRQDLNRTRKRPKAVVMATGTNDLTNMNEFRRQVIRARAMLPKRVKLVWVNVYVDTTPEYNAVNRVLHSVDGVGVVSWSAQNVRYRVDGKSTLLYDGVHVNRLGCVVRNQAIKSALRR